MDDLISRQEAIEAVSDCGICIQRILDLPSVQQKQKWISVEERLPEGMGTYLVTLEYKEHGKAVTTLWYHGKGIGWDLRVADAVVAWMPLPEPYKEENNG